MKLPVLLLSLLMTVCSYAQVGIGTVTPDASSMLDITSDSQGLLAPRMKTGDRTSITNPAEGLLVFDTDEDAFYYYDTAATKWVKLITDSVERDNYVLVKSAADFPAPTGGTITLASNTLYEINGTIVLPNPIDLNNAYLVGRDSNDDVLYSAGGTIFSGSKGGSLRNLTLSAPNPGGTVFDIIDTVGDQNFVLQSAIIANSGNVGKIEGLNLVFMNVIQYVNNASGITYTDIGNLLLNNQGWFGNNGGVYETLTGDFNLIGKIGGFSEVTTASAAFDVTSVGAISGSAVLENVVFYGGGNYINGNSPYTGYNFTNDWTVSSPGIPEESDDVAGGNFYYDDDLTTGFAQTISDGTAVKLQGQGVDYSTKATSLFRFTAPGNNRLTYEGTKQRNLQINASLSVRVGAANGNFYAFLIAKNGAVVTESNSIVRIPNGTDIQNVALNAIVTMDPGDYIEIFTQRLTGADDDTLVVFSENLSIK